jgi:hypothetical protein
VIPHDTRWVPSRVEQQAFELLVRVRVAVVAPAAEVDVADSPQIGVSFAKRGLHPMDLGALAHLLKSFTLDGDILAVVGLLAGTAAGWTLTNYYEQQIRTRKLKVNRKS